MAKVTPMLRFIRAMTKEQQEAFAAAVGTTRVYDRTKEVKRSAL